MNQKNTKLPIEGKIGFFFLSFFIVSMLSRHKILILSSLLLMVGYILRYRYDILSMVGVKRLKISKKEDSPIFENEEWFDDYFTVEYIDKNTISIGEPRYWQRNYSYLILGKEKALLFDSGSPFGDINKVVKKLTDLPVVLMLSHYHYDHVGNVDKFPTLFLAKNQLKKQTISENHSFTIHKKSHIGQIEGLKPPSVTYSRLFDDKEVIDLGNRTLQILYAGGHDEESIVLYDKENKQLFAGDFLLKGDIFAHKMLMPSANLEDYKKGMKNVAENLQDNVTIFLAHPKILDPSDERSQILGSQDVFDLDRFFDTVERNNTLPKKKKINDNLTVSY